MAPPSELSLLFELFTVNQRVRRALAVTMEESPLDPVEYAIYSLIMEEGPASPTALATRTGMPVTTMLDQLRAMSELGHITRSDNPEDGRSYLVSLSRAGLAAQAQTRSYFDATMGRILHALPIPEAEAQRTLRAIAEAADSALAELLLEDASSEP